MCAPGDDLGNICSLSMFRSLNPSTTSLFLAEGDSLGNPKDSLVLMKTWERLLLSSCPAVPAAAVESFSPLTLCRAQCCGCCWHDVGQREIKFRSCGKGGLGMLNEDI